MKRKIQRMVLLVLAVLPLSAAQAQFDDLKFKQALKLKKDLYLSEGSFTGGDRASSDFTVTNVRVAANPAGYDRVVIDLAGNSAGEKSMLAHPPFYLAEVNSVGRKIMVTLYGKPKLDFSTLSASQSVKKANLIKQIEFLPIVNSDRWSWTIHTVTSAKAEVFELTNPARIIIDLKK